MALPDITPPIDVAGGSNIYDVEGVVNDLIGQSIKDGHMEGSQILRLESQDAGNIDIPVPSARAGILSGLAFTWTGSLAADISAGNYQAEGESDSLAALQSISFAARHATLPRIDLVCGSIGGAILTVETGTAASSPQAPATPAECAPLYYVWIDPAAEGNPRDFVVYASRIDEAIPVQLGMSLDGQAIKTNLPTKVKSLVFDPGVPFFNADVIQVDCSGGTVTVELPDPSDYHEWKWLFLDFTGNASGNNITLDADTVGGTTINGATTVTINSDYGSLIVLCLNGEYYAK